MTLYMHKETGSVDNKENWISDGAVESDFGDCLLEVVPNVEGEDGYDPAYGQYRPSA